MSRKPTLHALDAPGTDEDNGALPWSHLLLHLAQLHDRRNYMTIKKVTHDHQESNC